MPAGRVIVIAAPPTDHHAGYECVPADEIITIDENKQSRTLCELKVEGELEITGHQIID